MLTMRPPAHSLQQLAATLELTDTEAAAYAMLAAVSSASAREISVKTGVKRPTIYHALGTLEQKGLVAARSAGGKTTYSATPPNRLPRLIDERVARLEAQKKALAALAPILAAARSDEPPAQVAHYEGLAGIKTVVEEALYCRSGRWDIIAPKRNFFSEFDKTYARYFMETRRRRGIVARSLWERGEKPSRTLTPEEIRTRRPRYLPKVMHGKFRSVIILFDDKVAMISSYAALSAVLITSKEMQQTMSALFEGLWSASEDCVGADARRIKASAGT